MLPGMMTPKGSDTDDEIDAHFSGMITCNAAAGLTHRWIIDSGASDHMTPHIHNLSQLQAADNSTSINLPTGDMAQISHTGTATLDTGLTLYQVLCVPQFKHNLLSVQKLVKDSNCQVQFYPTHCVILDASTNHLKGIGKAHNGLYYLINHLTEAIPESWFSSDNAPTKCLAAETTQKPVL